MGLHNKIHRGNSIINKLLKNQYELKYQYTQKFNQT